MRSMSSPGSTNDGSASGEQASGAATMAQRAASPWSIRALFWVVVAGTVLSLAPIVSLGEFMLAHSPVFLVLLFSSAAAWGKDRRGQRTSTARVARILGACVVSTLFMVLLHLSIRSDRSSTAAIAYYWTPHFVPFFAVFGALLGWALVAVLGRLARSARTDETQSGAA